MCIVLLNFFLHEILFSSAMECSITLPSFKHCSFHCKLGTTCAVMQLELKIIFLFNTSHISLKVSTCLYNWYKSLVMIFPLSPLINESSFPTSDLCDFRLFVVPWSPSIVLRSIDLYSSQLTYYQYLCPLGCIYWRVLNQLKIENLVV
jgi:hypothetical protein